MGWTLGLGILAAGGPVTQDDNPGPSSSCKVTPVPANDIWLPCNPRKFHSFHPDPRWEKEVYNLLVQAQTKWQSLDCDQVITAKQFPAASYIRTLMETTVGQSDSMKAIKPINNVFFFN